MDELIDVIIPVYSGLQETRACLESVLAARGDVKCRVIAVNDASPDSNITFFLRQLASESLVLLIENPTNLGFVRSVNRGLTQSQSNDVVLLNADTVVFDFWLDRLRKTAYLNDSIGTVTPLSNNATILSYPDFETGNAASVDDVRLFDTICATVNAHKYCMIPTAIGFCMFIRRDCINDTGLFDSVDYERGYAEENDFCLRSRLLGWDHCAALDVCVYHKGEISFGKRSEYLWRNLYILKDKYPAYDALIKEFISNDPLHAVRRDVDVYRMVNRSKANGVLFITTDLKGGTERFVQELADALEQEGKTVFTLYPKHVRNKDMAVVSVKDGSIVNLAYELPHECALLADDLCAFGIIEIRLHHFLNHHPSVFELLAKLNLPYSAYVHDYTWFCPRVNCLDINNVFCDSPDQATCERCIEKGGSQFGHHVDMEKYLSRSQDVLRNADEVIAPSHDCADRMARHFSALNLRVVPHQQGFDALKLKSPVRKNGVWRIGIIGAIGDHKGYPLLLSMAKDALARDLPFEFVVIGFTQDDVPLLELGNVFITGKYAEDEAGGLIAMQDVSAALFLSIWPETWCYTLSEAWKSGIYPISLDIGAIAERIKQNGQGFLLPCNRQPSEYNDLLLAFLENSAIR